MRADIAAREQGRDPRPELNLPLPDTRDHIDAALSELRMLETEIESLQAALPRRTRHREALDREIAERERESAGLEKFASEAVRAREGARREGKAERENTGEWCVLQGTRCKGQALTDAGTKARPRY